MEETNPVKALVQAIIAENIKNCQMPLNVFLGESRVYGKRAEEDKVALCAAGLSADCIERVPVVCDLLAESQTNYLAGTTEKQENQKKWNQQYSRALFVRDEIESAIEFGCRNDEEMQEKLRQVKEGDSIEDTISDLRVLHSITTADVTPFQAISFDLALLDEALALANKLAELRAMLDESMYETSEVKFYRDQCRTQLLLDTNEICATGRYIFRHDPVKKARYQSKYLRDRRAASKRNSSDHEG